MIFEAYKSKLKPLLVERQDWIKKYLSVFILDVIGKGSGFLLLPIFLKYMTQSDFGLYTYLYYLVTVVSSVLTFGFGTSKSKLFFDYTEKRGELLYSMNSFLAFFFLCLITICLLTNLDVYIMDNLVANNKLNYAQLRYSFFAYTYFIVIFGMLNVYYQLDGKIQVFQKYNLVRILVMNSIVIGFLYLNNENGYITRVRWEAIISCLVFLPLFINYAKNFKFRFNKSMVKHALIIGLPVMGASIAAVFYSVSDKYFLQKYTNLELLAVYNLAIFLTMPLGLVVSTFNVLWLPIFFKESNNLSNYTKTNKVAKTLLLVLAAIAFLIWVCFWVAIKFGFVPNSYQFVTFIFPFIVISVILDAVSQLYNNFIIIFEKTWVTFCLTVILGLLMYFFNSLLIPHFGIYSTVGILIFLSIVRLVFIFAFTRNRVFQDKIMENHKINPVI